MLRARLIVALLAALVPFLPVEAKPPAVAGFPGWPTTFDGRPLAWLPLTETERRFSGEFPGEIARFTDGEREIVMRWIPSATRRVHLAKLCLRHAGWAISDEGLEVDADRRRWSCFTARRAGQELHVRERIHDDRGGEWTDASAWAWSALLGRSDGPWWAVSVATKVR